MTGVTITECQRCKGEGVIRRYRLVAECPDCSGNGYFATKETALAELKVNDRVTVIKGPRQGRYGVILAHSGNARSQTVEIEFQDGARPIVDYVPIASLERRRETK